MTRPPLSKFKLCLFSLIPVLVMLVLGEVGIRTWAYYFRTTYETYNPEIGRLELVRNLHLPDLDGREILINSKGFVGNEFTVEKPIGTYRIVAVGDSCTFGGSWNQAYPYFLERLLSSSTTSKFEVINAGIEGYNSTFALARIREEVIPLSPDLVIIYIGWNDLMKVNPDNLSKRGRYTWLATFIDKSYLMKALNKLLFYYLRPMVQKPKLESSEQDLHVFDQFVPTVYEENLERMVLAVKEGGARVLLLTRPTVAVLDMTQEDIAKQDLFFPYFAGTYSLGKFLSLHDSYNRSVLRVADKYQVPVVDLDRIVNGYPKPDLFWDTMHPSEKGQRLIAKVLFNAMPQFVGNVLPPPPKDDY